MRNDLEQTEYEALRATIRERGTARMWLVLAGLATWGALALALVATEVDRAVTLVPFLLLAATFEISFFIHTGVEQVGRYLQVYYEEDASSPTKHGWETTVMAYGKNFPGGLDPLFVTLFTVVGVVNFLSAFLAAARHPEWIAVSLVAHLIFGWRLVTARRLSANQRTVDLERFRALRTPQASN